MTQPAAPSATPPRALHWDAASRRLSLLDQRALPKDVRWLTPTTVDAVVEAITTLAVRGAPAIGVAAALGLVAAHAGQGSPRDRWSADIARLAAARPTAVNLPWAMARMQARLDATDDTAIDDTLAAEAEAILAEDVAMCEAIGRHGSALLRDGMRVLTHCNAGALATSGIGTALAPVYTAAAAGRRVAVIADETRPLLQGSRITSWELTQAGIPVTVCTDSMAASLMQAGRVDLVLVGADRIAANGDAANKIGTYGLAVLARHHGIPFHVAAPWSTIDPACPDGAAIPIEHRGADEVRRIGDAWIAPRDVAVHNPAFDVTPAGLITAIVTDRGLHHPPYRF